MRAVSLLCAVITIFMVISISANVHAEGYILGGFDVSQYTLKQLEDAGFIRYFFILDHEGNQTAGYYKSVEEIAYAGHIRCFIEFNPRPFAGTTQDADKICRSKEYSYANPVYVFTNDLTQYDPSVLDAVGYTVWEIRFDAYPGIDPTQFTLPTLEMAGYMTRISSNDYLNLRKNQFQIINVILYDKYCYVDYTFQKFRELHAQITDPRYGRIIKVAGYMQFIPEQYDREHGIMQTPNYSSDHDVPIHSDTIGIDPMPLGILSGH